jgi:hypothetical protein
MRPSGTRPLGEVRRCWYSPFPSSEREGRDRERIASDHEFPVRHKITVSCLYKGDGRKREPENRQCDKRDLRRQASVCINAHQQ